MKELVFQVWKSCFQLPMAILYTIHPRTFLMSPLHSFPWKCGFCCTICLTFDILDQLIMHSCVDGGHLGCHLEFNPLCPWSRLSTQVFFTYLGVHYQDHYHGLTKVRYSVSDLCTNSDVLAVLQWDQCTQVCRFTFTRVVQTWTVCQPVKHHHHHSLLTTVQQLLTKASRIKHQVDCMTHFQKNCHL